MIRVVLPAHLRTLASFQGEVQLEVAGAVTQRSVLNALEERFPMLRGAIREHVTQQRRPFLRFFACGEDLSHESPDTALPPEVASGSEPLLIIGAIAGGSKSQKIYGNKIQSRSDLMRAINAYLNFNGNCRPAMEFYHRCLGGDLQLMPFAGSPVEVPEGAGDLILHARLAAHDGVLMASDTMPGMPYHPGNNFWVSLNCADTEETEKLFTAFSENAKVIMPVQETFWSAAFGMLTDQFGVNWMFNCDKPMS
jgi:uncharacterized glyoxalase superfamily protein PhnB